MSAPTTLANGAELTPATWADFVARLRHDCVGEGARNHCTADAIFIVQARRPIFGIDREYVDRRAVIVEDKHWEVPAEYYADLDDEGKANLDKLAEEDCDSRFLEAHPDNQWAILEELPDHTVTGMDDRWEYVCSHHTKDAAEAFIKRKKHNYREGLRVYVDAQVYCWEFNAIKEAILNGRLTLTEATPCP